MIEAPGFYPDIPEKLYHADPVIDPSLSSSVAKLLVHRSPRHARWAHPRLNPAKALEVEEYSAIKAVGSAAHRTLLGKGGAIKVLPYENFRTKEAQTLRDRALADGMTPVLADKMDEVDLMVEAARDQLASTDLAGYFDAPGQSELTMVWRQPVGNMGVWCRGRIDRLPDSVRDGGHVTIADLKTTSGSAHWDDWEGVAYDLAYDVQATMYPLGLKALIPNIRTVTFKFAVLEQKPPYGLSVCEFPGVAIAEAEQDVEIALKLWAVCTATGKWPSYDGVTRTMERAPWRSMRAEMRRMALQDVMRRWQRPLEIEGKAA